MFLLTKIKTTDLTWKTSNAGVKWKKRMFQDEPEALLGRKRWTGRPERSTAACRVAEASDAPTSEQVDW